MLNLEIQVREALIDQETNEAYKIVAKDPEKYISRVCKTLENLVLSVYESTEDLIDKTQGFWVKEKTVEEKRKEFEEEVLSKIRADLRNPEKLREMVRGDVKTCYLSREEIKAQVESYVADLKELEEEIGEEAIEEYKRAYVPLYDLLGKNDEFIRRLAKIAEKEGLEEAIKKERKHTVIKEIFPTAQEYREYHRKKWDALRNYFRGASTGFQRDGSLGKFLGVVLTGTGKSVEPLLMKSERNLEKTIEVIYGER